MFDRLLQNNTVVKIIAACLAILLWLVVHSGEEPLSGSGGWSGMSQQLRDKQVKVIYDEQNYSLVGEPKVTLTLRGQALDVVNAIALGDKIKVMADASLLKEGTYDVPVFTQGVPNGVTVESASVSITLEANVNKEVNVKLETVGKPKDGMTVGEALITPKTVIVSGAKTSINAVEQVVATIALDEAAESIHTSVPITAVDKAGKPVKNVRLSRDRVEVNLPITKPSKSVPVRLQFKGELPPGLAVEAVDQNTSVTIYGTPQALDSIESFPAPVIDLTGLSKSESRKIKLTEVDGVTSVQPQEIEVEIKVVESVQRTFPDIPLKVTGLREGQSYSLLTSSDRVQVTVEGAKSLIDKLTAADLIAAVDVTNQPAGRNEMHVQVSAPNFIKVVSTDPPAFTLNLKK